MPPDPIATWLLGVGIDPEALVFAFVMASLMTVAVVLARKLAPPL